MENIKDLLDPLQNILPTQSVDLVKTCSCGDVHKADIAAMVDTQVCNLLNKKTLTAQEVAFLTTLAALAKEYK